MHEQLRLTSQLVAPQAFQRQVLDIFDWTVSLSPLALKDDDFLKQAHAAELTASEVGIYGGGRYYCAVSLRD